MSMLHKSGTLPNREEDLDYSKKVFQEKEWFKTKYQIPAGIPRDVIDRVNNVQAFQDLIWKQPAKTMIKNFGGTAEELSLLTCTNWLSSDHVLWAINKLNKTQSGVLVECVSTMSPDMFARILTKKFPKKKPTQVVFVANVLLTASEVFFSTYDKPGNHWVVISIDIGERPVLKYCDSLCREAPTDLLPYLSKYTQILTVDINKASVHIVNRPLTTLPTSNYPIQTFTDVCGLVALISVSIAALDSRLFQELTGPRPGLRQFFQEPTKYQHYLRRVLICWFMEGAIDITLLQTQTCESSSRWPSETTHSNMDSYDLQLGPERIATNKPHTDTKRQNCGNKNQFRSNNLPNRKNSCCELCELKFCTIKELITHYNFDHQKNLKILKRIFTSEEEFSEWRKTIEKNTHSQFTKLCGPLITGESTQCIRFYCRRSGIRKPLQVRKRAPKPLGPCKMGRNCTAFMTARKNLQHGSDGSIRVEYCLQHTGHDFKLGYLQISDEKRTQIAGKLHQGLEPNKVLGDLRENMTVIDRDSLIKLRDIHNIKQQFNISRTVKHKDDTTSVALWVEEFSKEDNNPIICFKQQNAEHKYMQKEDFLLCIQTKFQKEMMKKHASKIILMDSTHCTTQYDFYLTSILVLDEYQQSIPVAWAISNREDANILQIFMEAIRIHCDQSFETDYFMSDLANNFYNAWCQVFPKPKQRLYCDWHLDRAWSKKAQEVIKDHELAQNIYQHIKALQQLLDESEFRKDLQCFLNYITEKGCDVFHNYFHNTYVSEDKITQWAHCFRINSPTNTNMHCESFHRVLKTNYLKRNQNRRVDKLLCVLIRIAKDKAIDQLIKKEMGAVSTRMIEIRKRHKDAEHIVGIQKNAEEDGEIIEWIVPSSSGHNQIYIVTQNSDQPCGCKLICDLCSVCRHMYNCTCEYFRHKHLICKHIHAVHMAFNRDRQQNPKVEQDVFDDIHVYQQTLCEKKNHCSDNVQELESSSMDVMTDLLNLIKKVSSDNDVNTLKGLIQGLRSEYKIACGTNQLAVGNSFEKKKIFSSTKCVDKQRRFFSTKRKRSKNSKRPFNKQLDSEVIVKLHHQLSDVSPHVCSKCWKHDDNTHGEEVHWFECEVCMSWQHVACGEGQTSYCSSCKS